MNSSPKFVATFHGLLFRITRSGHSEIMDDISITDYIYQLFCLDRFINASIFAIFCILALFSCVSIKRKSYLTPNLWTLRLEWWMGFVYSGFHLFLSFLGHFFPKLVSIIFMILAIVLGFLAIVMALNELFSSSLLTTKIRRDFFIFKRLKISLFTLILAFLSFIYIIIWILAKSAVLGELIALLIVFASLRIIKAKSLKTGCYFLIIVGVSEVICEIQQFVYLQHQVFFSETPFILSMGSFLTDSEFSIWNLIFPGILLRYFHRYDSNKGVRVYFIYGLFSLFCGSVAYILVSFIVMNRISFFLYTVPFMIGLSSLLAFQRNENLDLWEGQFYDREEAVIQLKDVTKEEVFKTKELFEGMLDSSFESIDREECKSSNEFGEKVIFGGKKIENQEDKTNNNKQKQS